MGLGVQLGAGGVPARDWGAGQGPTLSHGPTRLSRQVERDPGCWRDGGTRRQPPGVTGVRRAVQEDELPAPALGCAQA